MKLNFWQILGVALLIAGAAWWIWDKNRNAPADKNPANIPAAATIRPSR